MKEILKNQSKKFINQLINGIYFVISVFIIVGISVYASTQLSNVENGQTLDAGTLNGIINWINNEGVTKENLPENLEVTYHFGVGRNEMPCNSANDVVSAFGIHGSYGDDRITHASWINGEWRQWHYNSDNYELKQNSINVVCKK